MFKFLVIVLLCIIALHSCAADMSMYIVHLPFNNGTSLALVNGTSYHSVNIPVNPFDGYYVKRIW